VIEFDYVKVVKPVPLLKKHLPLLAGPGWIMQAKEDGHFRVLYKDEYGGYHAYGLRFSDVTGKRDNVIDNMSPHVISVLDKMDRGTMLTGEVVVPGGTATDVPHALKVAPETVQYRTFGLLALSNKVGVHSVSEAEDYCLNRGIDHVQSIYFVNHLAKLNADFEYLDHLRQIAKVHGLEGYIIKHSTQLFMAKIKGEETLDLICTGTTRANFGLTGKYEGLIGALVCETADGVEVCQISGMTDELRRSFTANPPIGMVLEVMCQGFAKNGRLQHPRYKGTRPDKSRDMADTLKSAKEKCRVT
jgi:ATP-dependent DNA ligase